MKVLLLYTSYEGQTAKIMQRLKSILDLSYQCDLCLLTRDSQIALSQYDSVLIASSIRYGSYHKLIKRFIRQNESQLNQMISGFIGVNLVARKPDKNKPETNIYTRKLLDKIKWKPTIKTVFAGALYYPKYHFIDRNMIRFIMWLGKGETDTSKTVIEYTNWQDVEEFALKYIKLLKDN